MQKTIREIIKEKLNNIWQNIETLTIEELSRNLVELSAMIGNIGENIIILEQKFINKQLEIIQENDEMSCKEVEIRSKVLPEYLEFSQAKVLEKAIIETTRALKFRIKILINESEASRNL